MKRLITFVVTSWRQILVFSLVTLFVITILWAELGTLVPSFSVPELAARADANSINKLLANPLFLPHKLMQYTLLRLGHTGAFWMRSVSAIWGLVVVLIFFDIIRQWYSRRIAIMGTALLLTSAWFLHMSRLATPEIMYTISIGLLWVGMRLKSVSAPRVRTIFASILILGCCLYVPGLAWIVVPLLIWQRKLIWSEYKMIPKTLALITAIGVIVGAAPLVYGFINDPSLLRAWLFIPSQIEPRVWLSNLWHIPVWFTLRGPELPVYWLGRAPMLDIFSLVMALLGVFVLSYYRLLDRVRAVVAILLLSLILAIFNGWIALAIGLPILFVVISAGVALFLQQWFTVFPYNPLARVFGVTIVAFVVVLACVYNVRAYFIAWPRSPETQQVFIIKP